MDARIDIVDLLLTEPAGEYLLEERDGWRLLWRISEGAPPDGSFDPAGTWWLGQA